MQHAGLRFLLPYMRPYHRHLLIGTLYALIGAAASAFSPTLLGMAVDEVLAGIRADVLALYAVGLVALAIVLATFRYLLRMLTGEIAAGVSYQMGMDLFNRMLILDKAALAQYGTGELLSRASNDFIYIWRFYSAGFQMAMHALLLLAIGCALMAVTSPPLALLVVVMIVVTVAVQVVLGPVIERSFDRVQQQLAHLSAYAQEHLSAQRMLAAYAQETAAVARFKAANDLLAHRNIDFVLRSSAIAPLPGLVVRLAAALVVGIGGAMIIAGQLTIGQYVQFIVYLGLLSGAAQSLSSPR
jgi:ATP-binding cassette subfamily B protein